MGDFSMQLPRFLVAKMREIWDFDCVITMQVDGLTPNVGSNGLVPYPDSLMR